MKIREVIVEDQKVHTDLNNDGIPDSHQSATPGMRAHHDLVNSDPYAAWRYAAYYLPGAGAADGKYHHQPKPYH